MENDQKIKLKDAIHKKLKTVKKDIVAFALLAKPVSPDNAIGRLTRMEAISSKSINDAALKKARDTRSKLECALAKIDRPDFGLCRECDEPIPSARLLILPETDLCVRCAEAIALSVRTR